VIKKEAEKILKYKDLIIKIQRMLNVNNKSDASNNTNSCNPLKINQRISEKNTGKKQNEGNTKKTYLALHTYIHRNVLM
jgi:hypothetical protein